MAISLHRILETETDEYLFMERLLTDAFPVEEYRELSELQSLTRTKRIFHNNIIYDGTTPVGIITYWEFPGFYYIEHFATLAEMRNHGYGSKVLAYLKTRFAAPIVLEVECPDEEIAQRRICFYERQGFSLWRSEYIQPPYRPGGDSLRLMLMACGNLMEDRDFDFIKRTIHKEVYGFEE